MMQIQIRLVVETVLDVDLPLEKLERNNPAGFESCIADIQALLRQAERGFLPQERLSGEPCILPSAEGFEGDLAERGFLPQERLSGEPCILPSAEAGAILEASSHLQQVSILPNPYQEVCSFVLTPHSLAALRAYIQERHYNEIRIEVIGYPMDTSIGNIVKIAYCPPDGPAQTMCCVC